MSTVQLRVELPTYAHSFTIQVPDISTIRDVKQEIFLNCPGGPQVTGQRLIWRGRYLTDDEKLEDLWKSPDEPRIVHLSVHPSAWTSKPPTPSTSSSTANPQIREQSIYSTNSTYTTMPFTSSFISSLQNPAPTRTIPLPSSQHHPLTYVLQKHQHALGFLTKGKSNHVEPSLDMGTLRARAIQFVESHGHQWPSILDEPFPSTTDAGGVVYEHTVIDGKSYLSLKNSWEKPTETQTHALKVLSYTFSLLKLPPESPRRTTVPHSEPVAIPPNLHALLQQVGLPPVQGDAEHHRHLLQQLQGQRLNPNERVIEINLNLRPFLLPLFMLAFRTLLLLYFVAPARKPVFGILLVAWILYEIWQPIRNAFARAAADQQQQRQGGEAGGAGAGGNQNHNQPQAHAAPEGAQGQNQPNAPPQRNRQPGATGALIDTIASFGIQQEEAELTRGDVAEPGLRRKVGAFVTLFLATVHPAVWNRRRVALRQREGRIRTEERARNAPVEPEGEGEEQDLARRTAAQESRDRLQAQHVRRRPWIQRYIQRVMREEWVDDSD
ncbi:hypothetical protein L218DRAFT_901729 [Marasmius fiardii PR-910]|nr:hypothetical protein L218DRAFT_901729 [Marasmius fiardii PR-910]